MTGQTNSAAGDLGMPGAQPAPTPAVPQMSVAEAASRKNEFMADKAKVDALFAGDANATAEWRNIVNAISAQPVAPTDPREELVEHINEASGYSLSDGALDQVRNNTPITPEERRMTLAQDRAVVPATIFATELPGTARYRTALDPPDTLRL